MSSRIFLIVIMSFEINAFGRLPSEFEIADSRPMAASQAETLSPEVLTEEEQFFEKVLDELDSLSSAEIVKFLQGPIKSEVDSQRYWENFAGFGLAGSSLLSLSHSVKIDSEIARGRRTGALFKDAVKSRSFFGLLGASLGAASAYFLFSDLDVENEALTASLCLIPDLTLKEFILDLSEDERVPMYERRCIREELENAYVGYRFFELNSK